MMLPGGQRASARVRSNTSNDVSRPPYFRLSSSIRKQACFMVSLAPAVVNEACQTCICDRVEQAHRKQGKCLKCRHVCNAAALIGMKEMKAVATVHASDAAAAVCCCTSCGTTCLSCHATC